MAIDATMAEDATMFMATQHFFEDDTIAADTSIDEYEEPGQSSQTEPLKVRNFISFSLIQS